MVLRRLRNWMFAGTLAPDLEPLPLGGNATGTDFLEEYSASVQNAVAEFEAQIASLQRRRAAENLPSAPAEGNRSDVELKNHAKAMLPTLDALDRIIEYGDAQGTKDEMFENWLTSIKAMRTRLQRTLEGIGLSAINSVGSEVDLEIHDVVAVVPRGSFPLNTVVSEQQRGYLFKGKLLRDAKVVVAQ